MSTVIINKPELLLEYFKILLSNGITTGISEDDYFKCMGELMHKIAMQGFFACTENESFSDIVEQANQINENRNTINNSAGIKLKTINEGKLIALPTYELVGGYKNKIITGRFFSEDDILKQYLNPLITPITLSCYPLDKTWSSDIELAQKVSAFFVNDLMSRYVKGRIEEGYWPSQCNDIDEYIFNRDLALIIDEKGTADTFEKAYLHGIRVTSKLLDARRQSKEEGEIQFSNDSRYMLAHANFLKLVLPNELMFLKDYRRSTYATWVPSINLTITDDEVNYKISSCIYSETNGECINEYNKTEGSVSENTVHLMEKRRKKLRL